MKSFLLVMEIPTVDLLIYVISLIYQLGSDITAGFLPKRIFALVGFLVYAFSTLLQIMESSAKI